MLGLLYRYHLDLASKQVASGKHFAFAFGLIVSHFNDIHHAMSTQGTMSR